MMVKRPIVYDENKVIIGGNMRYRAIQSLGMTEIPDEWVSDASDFTPEERHRFVMQDNAEMGEHDYDMVANQYDLEDLDAWGIDVPYADVTEEVEEDEAPEVSSEPPVSQLGVVYQLGRHRVMCGSSKDFGDLSELMNGVQADLWLTDPPYGVSYIEKNLAVNSQVVKNMVGKKIIDDDLSIDEMAKLWKEVADNAIANCKDDASYYWFACQGGDQMMMMMMLGEAGWLVRHELIWVKSSMVFGRSDYHYQHEPIIYGWKKSGKHNWYSDRKQTSILEYDRPNKSDLHPTTKPIELVTYLMGNNTKSGDVVLDTFLGSGTTLIACEQTDRTCYGMELDPKYVDVIRKRYAKFISPDNELPENWEELTPAISGGVQAK